jgi:hypothetical protein
MEPDLHREATNGAATRELTGEAMPPAWAAHCLGIPERSWCGSPDCEQNPKHKKVLQLSVAAGVN